MSLIFAIGDIHGCLDELLELVKKCQNYAALKEWGGEQPHKFVFLGDYVDRGPASCQVIEWMMADNVNKICLKGNHEDMMAKWDQNWMSNGGTFTLDSYGFIREPEGWHNGALFDQYEQEMHKLNNHRQWVNSLPVMHQDEHRIYVHAGLDPRVELEHQNEDSILWIRDQFLNSDKDFGKLVVHGHTPYHFKGEMQQKPNRLNLDTACCLGGHLTAAVFSDEKRDPLDFIHVARPRRM